MTYLKNSESDLSSRLVRPAIALFIVATFFCGSLLNAVDAQRTNVPRLNEDQRILHVLNRLGFGARPGDIERVKAMGLEQYINQQLTPDKINDEVADAKLKNLSTLNMSTAELYEKFPQPGLLLRQLEQRGALPAGLAAARDNRAQAPGNALGATANPKTSNATAMNDETNGAEKHRWMRRL